MILHPNAKLEGKRMAGTLDPDGKSLFDEMVAVAKRDGSGLVSYRWPKPGADAPVKGFLRRTVQALGLDRRLGYLH